MSVTERSIVGPKGRVVIPARFREQLGIDEGDELIFAIGGSGALTITAPQALVQALAGAWSGTNASLVDELFADRAADIERAG